MNNNRFIGCDSDFALADVVLWGAPLDVTTTYRPGTRFACKAIRTEAFGLETYSPYHDSDLLDYKTCDYGDLEFGYGEIAKDAVKKIENMTSKILEKDKIPFMIGGEHLVTYGAFKACYDKYPDLVIIQLDAHTDLQDKYYGETYSHATVLRRCYDLVKEDRIFQFGIRSGAKNVFEFAKEHTYLIKSNLDTLEEVVNSLIGKNVYITIDLDVLDPSVLKGTGTPDPGGITYLDLQQAILLFSKLKIVGSDIVELAPMLDKSNVSTIIACKTIREMLLTIHKSRSDCNVKKEVGI